jgi:Na+/H+-dicarboxylate symporter
MPNRFTMYILVAMVLGLLVGWQCNVHLVAAQNEVLASNLKIITDIFLRLIKMIIAPLVVSTLIVGIAHMGDTKALGRAGAKTMAWFIGASAISLMLGAVMVTLLKPGVGLDLALPAENAVVDIQKTGLSLQEFVVYMVPMSIFDAMAKNQILPIVLFSVFFGVACAAMKEKAKIVVDFFEQLSYIMLKVTGYVMLFAPFAVFSALASVVATKGLAILSKYLLFAGGFFGSLAILWCILIFAGFLVLGPSVIRLIKGMREPIAIAFSTASSEAAYPRTLDQLQQFGVSRRIGSFVLPLGYSFNLDGSMMYCTFGTIFIAQAYGIHLSFSEILTMLLLLMVTSKGMAAVPRASLVVIAATLPHFNIPETGLLLLLAVDHFLDMGRSATNVVGNSIATAVVAKWEGELQSGPATDPVRT